MISRASSWVGSGFSASAAVIVVRNPGVQNPHCNPWQSANACCTGDSVPSGSVSPSTVVISALSALTASIRQDRVATPSTRTVHAPQTPCSQPTCVPVSLRSCRRQSDSSRRAGTVTVWTTPFTISRTSNEFVRCPVLVMGPAPLRAAGALVQGPLGQHPGQVPPITRRRVDVVARPHLAHREPPGLREVGLGQIAATSPHASVRSSTSGVPATDR